MNYREKLIALHSELPQRLNIFLKKIKDEGLNEYNSPRIISGLKLMIWYEYAIQQNIQTTKSLCRDFGILKSKIFEFREVDISPGMSADIIYPLLSDHRELISRITAWKYKWIEDDLKKGEPQYIIQRILCDDYDEAHKLLGRFREYYEPSPFNEVDATVLEAILTNKRDDLLKNLNFLLESKNHNARNRIYPIRRDIFSFPAVGFLKLAWIKGMEIEINHPLIPMDLMPNEPISNYKPQFSFIKDIVL